MRLQHAKQVAEALPAENPHQQQAKAEIVAEVERLRWRTWHGKAKDALITLKRLRTLLPALEREPVRKPKRALRAIDRCLRSQSLAGQLRRAMARWPAGRHVAHRGHGQLPDQPTHGQVAADALVPARGRPAAAGPLCRLQWRTWVRLRPAVQASFRFRAARGGGGVVPQLLDSPAGISAESGHRSCLAGLRPHRAATPGRAASPSACPAASGPGTPGPGLIFTLDHACFRRLVVLAAPLGAVARRLRSGGARGCEQESNE